MCTTSYFEPYGYKFQNVNFKFSLFQAVCDDKMMISANTEWPGSVHDARVLRNSDLYHKAEQGEMVMDGKFIVGDSAYPLKVWRTAPFKNYPRLTNEQTAGLELDPSQI